jgi:hypothetical protein
LDTLEFLSVQSAQNYFEQYQILFSRSAKKNPFDHYQIFISRSDKNPSPKFKVSPLIQSSVSRCVIWSGFKFFLVDSAQSLKMQTTPIPKDDDIHPSTNDSSFLDWLNTSFNTQTFSGPLTFFRAINPLRSDFHAESTQPTLATLPPLIISQPTSPIGPSTQLDLFVSTPTSTNVPSCDAQCSPMVKDPRETIINQGLTSLGMQKFSEMNVTSLLPSPLPRTQS